MKGYRFSKYFKQDQDKTPFEKLLQLFLQLLIYTSGDVQEAMNWLNELDKEYKLTDNNYTMADFLKDLKDKGYLKEEENDTLVLTAKSERSIRKNSLDEIFGKLKRAKQGNHSTHFTGIGDEITGDIREYHFGDSADQISMTDSLRNAQINHGINDFTLREDDLEVMEKELKTQTSTVLMIDISHSMILYGEDRITPAKKVAMALS